MAASSRWAPRTHPVYEGWYERLLGDGRLLSIKPPSPNGWCQQWFVAISDSTDGCLDSAHSAVTATGGALTERAAKAWASKWAKRVLKA